MRPRRRLRARSDFTMSEVFALAPAVHACIDQTTIVFLDLRRDRYFAVPAERAPAIAGVCDAGSGRAGDKLLALGLIAHGATRSTFAASGSGQITNSIERPVAPTKVRVAEGVAVLAGCVRASAALRLRRLDKTFAAIARLKRRRPAYLTSRSGDAVATFETLRPWYPRPRVCLFDSLALMFFLLEQGLRPTLVMGVRAEPFSAHCWIEEDGVVLSDTLEHCVSFVPIARA